MNVKETKTYGNDTWTFFFLVFLFCQTPSVTSLETLVLSQAPPLALSITALHSLSNQRISPSISLTAEPLSPLPCSCQRRSSITASRFHATCLLSICTSSLLSDSMTTNHEATRGPMGLWHLAKQVAWEMRPQTGVYTSMFRGELSCHNPSAI